MASNFQESVPLATDTKPTALLCTSNGVGLGHLARVMAIAEEMKETFNTVIFTLSAAVSIPVELGFQAEYLRSYDYENLDSRRWNVLVRERMLHLFDMYQPSVVLYDGTHPYAGICAALEMTPSIFKVWQRRGMWRPHLGDEAMLRERYFDLVVEPGDFAAENDTGLTKNGTATSLNPIRFGPDFLSRTEARKRLGLEPNEPAALIQLGAGQINDTNSLISQIVAEVSACGVRPVVAASVLAQPLDVENESVMVVQLFPISEYFHAFDFGVFAGGYNSFHEAMAAWLPALFVPNLATKLDNQEARVQWAVDRQMAAVWTGTGGLALTIRSLANPDHRAGMRKRMQSLPVTNGAAQVAQLLAEHGSGDTNSRSEDER